MKAEKKKSIYNEEIIDRKAVKSNIFTNPFGKYEEMNFMERCHDVEFVRFNKDVWKKLSSDEKLEIDRICDEKLRVYYEKSGFKKNCN